MKRIATVAFVLIAVGFFGRSYQQQSSVIDFHESFNVKVSQAAEQRLAARVPGYGLSDFLADPQVIEALGVRAARETAGLNTVQDCIAAENVWLPVLKARHAKVCRTLVKDLNASTYLSVRAGLTTAVANECHRINHPGVPGSPPPKGQIVKDAMKVADCDTDR